MSTPAATAPLSFEQRFALSCDSRIWRDTASRYIFPTIWRLSGTLDAECFHNSIAELIRRHGVLRTRIIDVNGALTQQMRDGGLESFAEVNRTHSSEDDPDLESVCRELSSKRPLAGGQLFYFRLLELSSREHVFIYGVDSMILDWMSSHRLIRELWTLYGAFLIGHPSPFKNTPSQYVDYAANQQSTTAAWWERIQSYWHERLCGATRLHWPSDYRPANGEERRYGMPMAHINFDEAWTNRLRAAAKRMQTPLSLLALTAYLASLSRWCDQRDVLIALTVAGHQQPSLSAMLGTFTHPLYLRFTLTGHETYDQLLTTVRRELTEAMSHRDFGKVASETETLLWSNVFTWVPPSCTLTTIPTFAEKLHMGITLEPLQIPCVLPESEAFLSPYDIDISFFDNEKDISGYILYRGDLCKKDAVERLAQDCQATLQALSRT